MFIQTIEQAINSYKQPHIKIIKVEQYCDDIIIWIQPMNI